MITTGEVLQKIRPNASWRLIEDDLSTITWMGDDKNDKGIPSEKEVEDTRKIMQAEYDTNQPLKLLREERDKKLKEEVDSKTCEAYNNGTQLSTEWKNYRQALLDMTLQTPTLDENGNLKAGLELDEIYWPTKPE